MIIRIVKMTFREDKVDDFLKIFDQNKEQIRLFNGCGHLELLRVIDQPNVFMTYSFWGSGADLENYRQSELFNVVWKNTKALFAERPQAWSVKQEVVL